MTKLPLSRTNHSFVKHSLISSRTFRHIITSWGTICRLYSLSVTANTLPMVIDLAELIGETMCGIFVVIDSNDALSSSSSSSSSLIQTSSIESSSIESSCMARGIDCKVAILSSSILSRGPDGLRTHSIQLPPAISPASSSSIPLSLIFGASVLHVQGNDTTSQPYLDQHQNILCWNGEVFGGLTRDLRVSDTIAVSTLLHEICLETNSASCITEKLSRICGPYAFLYYHKLTNRLFYGRDPFGRRSLLACYVDNKVAAICSVSPIFSPSAHFASRFIFSPSEVWSEVSIDGVFEIPLSRVELHEPMQAPGTIIPSVLPSFIPWPVTRLRLSRQHRTISEFSSLDSELRTELGSWSSVFLSRLINAVFTRVECLLVGAGGGRDQPLTNSDVLTNDAKERETGEQTYPPSCGIGVLFSGGIDSVLLSGCLHLALERLITLIGSFSMDAESQYRLRKACTAPIDLINVTFDTSAGDRPSPDRLAAIYAISELKRLYPGRLWRMIHVNVLPDERQHHENHIRSLIYPADTHMDLNIGTAFWFAARGIGFLHEYSLEEAAAALAAEENGRPMVRVGAEGAAKSVGRKVPSDKVMSTQSCSQSAELNFPSIESAGASTEDPSVGAKATALKNSCANPACSRVPKEGCAVGACKRCCCKGLVSKLRLEHVSVCTVHKLRSQENESPVAAIETTVSEQVTEGGLPNPPKHRLVRSDCRALLVGIGADEQMAGYGRHRTVYFNALNSGKMPMHSSDDVKTADFATDSTIQGASEAMGSVDETTAVWKSDPIRFAFDALEQELSVDLERLWKRNLGRDDRCVSDNGREAWFPFLDENVVGLIQSLPMSEIADLSLPQGEGDKKLLRDAAASIGLMNCSKFVKRAIQFGTRVAKDTNKQYHGSHRKGKGTHKI